LGCKQTTDSSGRGSADSGKLRPCGCIAACLLCGSTKCGWEAGIKQRLIDATIVAAAFLTAIAFWTRNMIAIALLLPAGILLVRHRARSKAERQRREALALHSLAISLILPIIVVLALIFYFLWNLIPEIIVHWQ
jgi:hypothetical protein